MSDKVYQIITDRIIKSLESGVVPWQKPWGGSNGMPRNLSSGKPYRGINVWLLGSAGYASPHWVTFNQARNMGGSVKKGEKSTPIVFWSFPTEEQKAAGKKPFCRYYNVFNTSQCDGLVVPDAPVQAPVNPDAECDRVVRGYKLCPRIEHGGSGACYSPTLDFVRMPNRDAFIGSEEYYSTLFHELGHSTGHKDRLNREGVTQLVAFGSTNYSKEELVAEMTAAFICGVVGIENKTIDNSAAYIANWLQKLKNDKGMVISAAQHAQKAADMILGDTMKEAEEEQAE